MPTLAALKMFVSVAENGSFVGAAQELNTSKSTASKHIGDIETELGVRLFDRSTRSIRLTEAGTGYLGHVRSALDTLKKGNDEVERLALSPRGQLRISAPVSFATVQMSDLVRSFKELYPNVILDVQFESQQVDLIDNKYDIALRIADLKDSSLIAKKLASVPFSICASQQYLDTYGTPVRPQDLKNHECLSYGDSGETKTWELNEKSKNGLCHRIRIESCFCTNDSSVLVELALKGCGIIFEPKFRVNRYLESGELVPLFPDYKPLELGLFAIYVPGRHPPEKLRRFVDHIAASFNHIADF